MFGTKKLGHLQISSNFFSTSQFPMAFLQAQGLSRGRLPSRHAHQGGGGSDRGPAHPDAAVEVQGHLGAVATGPWGELGGFP